MSKIEEELLGNVSLDKKLEGWNTHQRMCIHLDDLIVNHDPEKINIFLKELHKSFYNSYGGYTKLHEGLNK
tara:strand:+ start:906 stop:1118 length:213 start_codon:yes stop_codon:yes gene_type:complete